jgi:predicted nucleic acid-binding protein
MKVVSNASPLIGLSRIGRLQVLKELWQEILIPDAVYKETVTDGVDKAGGKDIADACGSWIKVVSVNNRHEIDALRAVLDDGESEVIAYGQEARSDLLLLDNREPRLFAQTVKLMVMGTVGIIHLAWKRGLIQEPINELYKLKNEGFWIDEALIDFIKKEI